MNIHRNEEDKHWDELWIPYLICTRETKHIIRLLRHGPVLLRSGTFNINPRNSKLFGLRDEGMYYRRPQNKRKKQLMLRKPQFEAYINSIGGEAQDHGNWWEWDKKLSMRICKLLNHYSSFYPKLGFVNI